MLIVGLNADCVAVVRLSQSISMDHGPVVCILLVPSRICRGIHPCPTSSIIIHRKEKCGRSPRTSTHSHQTDAIHG